MDVEKIAERAKALRAQVHRVVVGQDHVINLMLLSLLAEGHILLEGVPGTAKTLLARTFAAGLSFDFNRIQFTPDLMPGDVIGTNLFNFQTNQFVLTKGAIFTEMLLADEINRSPPKTQAALLQAMQERQVTIDGKTHDLGAAFMVIATQNPIEQEGTYPLPEAQLDRFLFKVRVDYPSRDQEKDMVKLHGHRTTLPSMDDLGVTPVADKAFLVQARKTIGEIRLSEEMVEYLVDLVRATREHPSLLCGASPRSAIMLATAARSLAAVQSREYVIPDDVKKIVSPALSHRVVLSPAAEIEGTTAESVLKQIVEKVPAPR